jgi:hypothetical protein
LLNIARAEEEMKKKIEEMDKLREDLIKCERLKKELEVQNVTLLEQKNDLYLQLQTEQDAVADLEERVEKLVTQKADFEGQIKEMEDRFNQIFVKPGRKIHHYLCKRVFKIFNILLQFVIFSFHFPLDDLQFSSGIFLNAIFMRMLVVCPFGPFSFGHCVVCPSSIYGF